MFWTFKLVGSLVVLEIEYKEAEWEHYTAASIYISKAYQAVHECAVPRDFKQDMITGIRREDNREVKRCWRPSL